AAGACAKAPAGNARAGSTGPARAAGAWAPGGGDASALTRLPRRRRRPTRSFFASLTLVARGLFRHELLAQRGFQLLRGGGILLQVLARVLLALPDALAVVAVPGAGLLHQLGIDAHFDQLAFAADAL